MRRLFFLLTFVVLSSIYLKAQEIPELMLVAQPTMELNDDQRNPTITFYFDVKNIGTAKFKGDVMLMFEPDYKNHYGRKRVSVPKNKIRQIEMEVDINKIELDSTYNIVLIYQIEDEWYSLTNLDAFDSLVFQLNTNEIITDENLVVYSRPMVTTEYVYLGESRPPRPPHYIFAPTNIIINNYYEITTITEPEPKPDPDPDPETPPTPTPTKYNKTPFFIKSETTDNGYTPTTVIQKKPSIPAKSRVRSNTVSSSYNPPTPTYKPSKPTPPAPTPKTFNTNTNKTTITPKPTPTKTPSAPKGNPTKSTKSSVSSSKGSKK